MSKITLYGRLLNTSRLNSGLEMSQSLATFSGLENQTGSPKTKKISRRSQIKSNYKTPRTLEKHVLEAIMDYLDILEAKEKLFAYRTQVASIPVYRFNGTKGYIKTGRRGVPDITVCLKGGKFVGIEVKAPDKKNNVSQWQSTVKGDIERLGGQYWVVTSVDEVKELINKVLD